MSLAETSVRRPVTTIMVYLGVALLGLISLSKLPQAMFPNITFPQLTVVTRYGNAAPEEVETLITKIIEEAVGTVSNVKRITSKSKEGVSAVSAEFGWGTNMDFAALGMREKIDLVKSKLPRDAGEPIVMKFNPLDRPVAVLSVVGEMEPVEMLRYTRRHIKEALEKIEGVAACTLSGGTERQIQVELDQDAMQASGLALKDVTESLSESNLNYPAGTIKEKFYEYLIRTMGEYEKVEDIGDTTIALDDRNEQKQNNAPGTQYLSENSGLETGEGLGKRLLYLKDFASVTDGSKERTSFSRYNQASNISVTIQKQVVANVIDVSERIQKELKKIQQTLPEDIRVEVIYDQAEFVRNSIWGVFTAVWQGGMIAFLVLLYFLKSFRSALIVGTAIPISVLMAFTLMYFGKLSLNMMSLSGLALGIGMMVDSAIVVIENISRVRSTGKKPKEAAIDGTVEVGHAVVASTLTTIAVFLPMIFVVGVAGQLFKDISFTVTFSLIASMLVALSLIPRLCTGASEYNQAKREQISLWMEVLDYPLQLIEKVYDRTARWFLKNQGKSLFVIFITFLFGLYLFTKLDTEVMPKIDQGEFIVKLTMNTGTLLEETNRKVQILEESILALSEVDSVAVSIGADEDEDSPSGALDALGSHEGQLVVSLKKDRKHPSRHTVQQIKSLLPEMDLVGAGVEFVLQESALGGVDQASASPIALGVKGHDLNKIKDIAEALVEKLEKIPGTFGVKHDYALPSPETKVHINKDRAALYGLSVTDIAQATQVALKGSIATKFKEDGREIDVLVRLREEDRNSMPKLRDLFVRSQSKNLNVALREVARLTPGKGPSEILRKEQERTITVTSEIFGRKQKDVIGDVDKVLRRMRVPDGYTIAYGGEREQMEETKRSLFFALALSILLVYMIMASQFESLWQPFIIMFTVPLSLVGVSGALYLWGTPVSAMVMLGIIMLSGIVVNNGIVLITTANDLRAVGRSAFDAAMEAGKLRLRPILMTTLTTVLGLLPLALGLSEGSEMQTPMAKTVMGGLSMSTVLTLYVIPAVYMLSEKVIDKLFARERVIITSSGETKVVR